jgi:hypothetical protein
MNPKPKPLLDPEDELEELYESGVSTKSTPFAVRFIAALLALVLILLSVQGIEYLIHPSPGKIPTLSAIQPFLGKPDGQAFSSYRPDDLDRVVRDSENTLKLVSNTVASNSCKSGDPVCQSNALFQFVRDNITYVPDPQFHDQLENPLSVLKTGGADCEDMAVLVGGLQKAIGNEARLVFIPGHAYAQVRIPNYKDQWISLEPTCKICKFGEVPTENQLQPMDYEDL